MAKKTNIIDITSKLKSRGKFPSYSKRFNNCIKTANKNGHCDCEICIFKNNLAINLIKMATDECCDYMNNTKTSIYIGDLMEALILTARMYYDATAEEEDDEF